MPDDIEQMPGKRKGVQIGASAVGSGAFCYLLGGDLADSAAAFSVRPCAVCLYFIYREKSVKTGAEYSGRSSGDLLLRGALPSGAGPSHQLHDHRFCDPMIPGGVYKRDPRYYGWRLHCRFCADDGCRAGGFKHCPGNGICTYHVL